MRASHVIAVAAAALVLAALVASRADVGPDAPPADGPAATSAATPPPAPAGEAARSPDPAPDPSAPPPRHRTVTAGGVDLELSAVDLTVDGPGPDGTLRVTASAEITYATSTPGAEVVEQGDRSVTVLRDDVAVAALTPETDRERRAALPSGGTAVVLGEDALTSATWAERAGEGGLSLAVVPAPWVRGGGEATLDLLGAQLAAVEPEAATDTMRDQLACHHLGARDKASWNLEPWRPDVGLLGTIAARCNPTEA